MKPILFNTEMVQAILEGRKTVTRRLIKCKYSNTHLKKFTNKYGTRLIELQNNVEGETFGKNPDGTSWQKLLGMREVEYDFKPYKPGDILYVRETWEEWTDGYVYKVPDPQAAYNYPASFIGKWKPSLYMPKEAARIFLRVKAIRVEKLGDMSIQDMIKEGINTDGIITNQGPIEYRVINRFEELWNSTIKKSELDKCGFSVSPWVWVIEFERISKEEALQH